MSKEYCFENLLISPNTWLSWCCLPIHRDKLFVYLLRTGNSITSADQADEFYVHLQRISDKCKYQNFLHFDFFFCNVREKLHRK
jgi:hypothetical protein